VADAKKLSQIRDFLDQDELLDNIFKLEVPTQSVYIKKRGNYNLYRRILFPGYIFVIIRRNSNIWQIFEKIDHPHIYGILMAGDKQVGEVTNEEWEIVLKWTKQEPSFPHIGLDEIVEINRGVFNKRLGRIVEENINVLKLEIQILGRTAIIDVKRAWVAHTHGT
jgi:transcriptional antiterminator NusG